MKFFRTLAYLLKRKPRFRRFENQEVAKEAFKYKGKVYYTFEDHFKLPAGRALAALGIYEELHSRTSKEYLQKHTDVMEQILSDPKKINIQTIAVMNKNLRERLELAPFPDHILKLASVTFFDDTESPYSYDFVYNKKKIDMWKKDPKILDFFLQTQFSKLIPFSTLSAKNAPMYFQVAEQIDQLHRNYLTEQESKKR